MPINLVNSGDPLTETDIDCPYCGSAFSVLVDASSGECDYIEDCVVCCQPIEFHLRAQGTDERTAGLQSRDNPGCVHLLHRTNISTGLGRAYPTGSAGPQNMSGARAIAERH